MSAILVVDKLALSCTKRSCTSVSVITSSLNDVQFPLYPVPSDALKLNNASSSAFVVIAGTFVCRSNFTVTTSLVFRPAELLPSEAVTDTIDGTACLPQLPPSTFVDVDAADEPSSLFKLALAFTVTDIPPARVRLYAAVPAHELESRWLWSHTSVSVITIVFLERRYAVTAVCALPTAVSTVMVDAPKDPVKLTLYAVASVPNRISSPCSMLPRMSSDVATDVLPAVATVTVPGSASQAYAPV